MKKKEFKRRNAMLLFKRWSNTKCAVFASLKREIQIGALATAYFTILGFHSTFANSAIDSISSKITLNEVQISARRASTLYQESGRVVTVLSRATIEKLPVQSIAGLLRGAFGVDIRERGPLGMQADVSMRGGSFDQVMILLNGINISDPQTGHYGLNLPVDLESIERVEILRGPAARVYGPNAFDGAINFVTKSSSQNEVSASVSAGAYGLYNFHAGLSQKTSLLNSYLSAQKGGSDGYIQNTDFEILNLFYRGELNPGRTRASLQLGYNEKGFGANSFYSATYPNQFEATRTMFAALSMQSEGQIRLKSDIYWRRHHDRFELFRDMRDAASWYAGHNYHLSEVTGVSANASSTWALGTSSLGGELRGEAVWSNVLGLPMDEPMDVPGEREGEFTRHFYRGNFSVFAEHNYNIGRFSLSGGILMNRHSKTGYGVDWYPGIDLSYMLSPDLKLMASYNKALRMPTFTDLFYSGPTNRGNAQLKPEEASTLESSLGLRKDWLDSSIGGFYRLGKNLIDWGRIPGEEVYTTSNINRVEALGAEFSAEADLSVLMPGQMWLQGFGMNYSYLWQDKKSDDGYESYYVLDHLRQKLNLNLLHGSGLANISVNWNLAYRERSGYYTESATGNKIDNKPFWLTDVRLIWQKKHLSIYAEASNLFDVSYADLGELRQPGRWLKAGLRMNIKGQK